MNEEKIVMGLIRKDCEINGCAEESRLAKMASLMNIHPEKYQRALENLIETRKIDKRGKNFFLV
uniref:Uncharacterized protein n=1 Tax=candidate division CPR3 bacterium TaxID=2268181 RepID=A0A7C5UVI9_UNCC3